MQVELLGLVNDFVEIARVLLEEEDIGVDSAHVLLDLLGLPLLV